MCESQSQSLQESATWKVTYYENPRNNSIPSCSSGFWYVTKNKAERKAHLLLYGCSLTRAVHLEVLKSMETSEFIPSLKRFIARRGRPKVIYSDNAKTFKAAAKWLRKLQQDERFHAFLAENAVKWRFNISRALWWGGQSERLISLFKLAFHKTIGNSTLTWEELENVVLDVEVALNNQPLNYFKDDIEFSVLTPSSMLSVNPYLMPEIEPGHTRSRSTNSKR